MSIMEYNGGAVVAMVGKDCVGIASDLRFGAQAQMIAKTQPKVYTVNEKTMVGLAGLATDNQTVMNMYKLREEREMEPKVVANLLSTMLYEKRFGPFFTEPVVCGLQGKEGKPFITAMDLIGAPVDAADFVITGTASEALYGMCESMFRPDLEPDDLFEVLGQCLLSGVDRDALSGWGGIVHIMTKEGVTTRILKGRQD